MQCLDKEYLKEKCELHKSIIGGEALLLIMNHIYGKARERKIDIREEGSHLHAEYYAFGKGKDKFFLDAEEFHSFYERMGEIIKKELEKENIIRDEEEIKEMYRKEFLYPEDNFDMF